MYKRKLFDTVLLSFLALLFFVLAPVNIAGAENLKDAFNIAENVATESGYNKDADKIEVIVGKVINALLAILGVIFICFIVYAGFTWLTARGEPDRVNAAKGIIRTSIIGLIIILAAYAISYFVLSRIAGETLTGVSSE